MKIEREIPRSSGSVPVPVPRWDEELIANLTEWARRIRWDIVVATCDAGSGHPGGSLSAADIVACLYFHHMRHDPKRPDWPDRDRFVLSKGHACPVLYAALAEAGYYPREQLWGLRKLGSPLQGHPDMRKVPGVEISTGSLGHGLAAGNGMALALRLDGRDAHVYVMIGDGESQEGSIWEAAMFAAHFRLGNLVAILDYNGLQIDGPVDEVMKLEPVAEKWAAFGWHVIEIDGHGIREILDGLETARRCTGPAVIIARTVKGKGVSTMEGVVDFHGKAIDPEHLDQALAEIDPERKIGR